MTFTTPAAEAEGACGRAECYFAETFSSMQHPDEPFLDQYDNPQGWALIMDGETITGVQKTLGEESFLSFVPTTVNRVQYPRGSIFSGRLPEGYRSDDSQRLVVQSGDLSNVVFSRVSSFALEPDRRAVDFQEMIRLSSNGLVGAAALDELQATAYGALGLSAVPSDAVAIY